MKLNLFKYLFLTAFAFLVNSSCAIVSAEEVNSIQGSSQQDSPALPAVDISSTVNIPNLKVDGIMYDKADPMAIVNDQLLKKGDIIEGAKIIEITESEVIFQYDNKNITKGIGEGGSGTPRKKAAPKRYYKKPKMDLKTYLPSIPSIKTVKSRRELEKVIQGNIIKIWRILMVLFIIAYIYMSAMTHIIANKTGTGYGWMAWIPIVNIFLLCMIAEKSFWWILLFFVPFGQIVFLIMMWGGIAESCGKSWWWGILSIFPVLNFIAAGYLAFSTQPAEIV